MHYLCSDQHADRRVLPFLSEKLVESFTFMACAKYLLHSLTTSCNIFPSENPNVFLSQELLQILFSFLLKTILTFMLKKSVYAKNKLSCLHILLISIITWPCGISESSIYSISMLDLFQHCHPCFSLSFYNIHFRGFLPKSNPHCLES